MSTLARTFSNQTKQNIKHASRKVAAEPFEILKSAKEQITPINQIPKEKPMQPPSPNLSGKEESGVTGGQTATETYRVRELESEVKQIALSKLVSDLQRQISEGREISLESYSNIPIEQKQVLKAQMEAVGVRLLQQEQTQESIEPSTKRSRRMQGAVKGMKGQMEKLKKKVETRMPPSG